MTIKYNHSGHIFAVITLLTFIGVAIAEPTLLTPNKAVDGARNYSSEDRPSKDNSSGDTSSEDKPRISPEDDSQESLSNDTINDASDPAIESSVTNAEDEPRPEKSTESKVFPGNNREKISSDITPNTDTVVNTDETVNQVDAGAVVLRLKREQTLMTHRNAVATLEENGPYHVQSSESLYDLGMELQEQGHYAESLNTLKQAMHVKRVNHGLHSLSQAPMLRGLITSQKALSQFEDVTTNYQQLANLSIRNHGPDSPELIPIYRELAQWHIDIYQIDTSSTRVDHLTTAHYLINRAAQNANQAPAITTSEHTKLLRTFALVTFYFSTHEGDEWATVTDSNFSGSASADKNFMVPMRAATLSKVSFRQGKSALEQIIALVEADPDATSEQKISAYVEIGDWHLLFNRRTKAMEYYLVAQQLIAESLSAKSGTDDTAAVAETEVAPEEASRGEISPEKISLGKKRHPDSERGTTRPEHAIIQISATSWFAKPTLLPMLRTETITNKIGSLFITAQVDISESGSPSRIKIISPSAKGNQAIRRAATNTIKNARFRPSFVNGQAVASPGATINFPLIR